jgi:hypothetical protein
MGKKESGYMLPGGKGANQAVAASLLGDTQLSVSTLYNCHVFAVVFPFPWRTRY